MTLLKSNLIQALSLAIKTQRQIEKEILCYTSDSALVAGWEATLKALQEGEEVKIKDN
jgi:hypothetical protein